MTRTISTLLLVLFTFVAVLAVSRFAMRTGLVPHDAVSLWAGAITAGDGQMPIGQILAAYPTIPFLTTTLVNFVTPGRHARPGPARRHRARAAGLELVQIVSKVGIPWLAAAAATLLLAFHPALLRAAIAGPAEIFLAAFLYLLGLRAL